MRIVSTIAPTGRREHFLVFDTFAGDKRLVTAILQSPDGGEHVSEVGQHVLDFAGSYHQAQQGQGAVDRVVYRVPVLAASTARSRVLSAFTAASDGDLVFFFGANDSVCAALVKALGVQALAGSAGFVPQ